MRTDDELRGFYADQPIDPAAEQRLRAVIAGADGERAGVESGARRWLAVAATAAVVVTGSVSAYHLRAAHTTVATGQATTAPAAPATVPLTPRIAAGILIDLARAGGSVSDVRGGSGAGLVTASFRYGDPVEGGVLTVTVCQPAAASRCALPSGSGVSPMMRADGSRLLLLRPALRSRLGYRIYAWQVHLARTDGVVVSVLDVPDGGPQFRLRPAATHDVITIATSGRWQVRLPRAVGEADARSVPGSGSEPLPEASPPPVSSPTSFPFAPASSGRPLPSSSPQVPVPSVTLTPSGGGLHPSTDEPRATR